MQTTERRNSNPDQRAPEEIKQMGPPKKYNVLVTVLLVAAMVLFGCVLIALVKKNPLIVSVN